MKLDRLMWGIILLFVGAVLLLENFNVINFYWGSVWRFWPVFLIIAGVNILFNRQRSQVGMAISIGVMVVMLGFLFYKGQQPTAHIWSSDNITGDIEIDDDPDWDTTGNTRKTTVFSEPLGKDSLKSVVLNINGGGTSFKLSGATDSLITADVTQKNGGYSLEKIVSGDSQVLNFRMQDKKSKWSMNGGGSDVDFRFNTQPEWTINVGMGAGEVDFDLTDYKVRTFKFDGGAAALDITLGSLLPITDVIVKTGVADVSLKIPTQSGCRIKTKTGLSSKDFSGFTKIDENTYETPNYKTSANKIFINFDGGLSSFEVTRY